MSEKVESGRLATGILRGPRPRQLVVIGKCAQTTAQQFSSCRVAHVREGRIVTDRPAVAHKAQHRWARYIIERGQRPAHVTAGLSCRSEIASRSCGATWISERNMPGSDDCNCLIASRSFSP